MADKQTPGTLSAAELRDLVGRSDIDTVWAVVPDLCGRPVGARFGSRAFVDEVLEGEMRLPASRLLKDFAGNAIQFPSSLRVDPSGMLVCRPDTASLRHAAWLDRTAVVICDVYAPGSDGGLYPLAPRSVLKRQMERARSASVSPRATLRTEFYCGDADGFEDPSANESASFVADEIHTAMRDSGVPVEYTRAASGPGQCEISLQSGSFLEAADRLLISKWAIKEIAGRMSAGVTFMARLNASVPPSTMQVKTSLWSADREAALFGGREPGRPSDLPAACGWWLGGLLRYARDATLLFAPNVNSYKRYRGDNGACSALGWNRDQSTVAFRVSGDGAQRNVDCSLPGADANPYLACAAILAAGLDGLANRTEPPPEVGRDAAAVRAVPRVPLAIAEAAELAHRSTFLRQILGENLVELVAHCGRWEQAHFEGVVTSWERDRYSRSC